MLGREALQWAAAEIGDGDNVTGSGIQDVERWT